MRWRLIVLGALAVAFAIGCILTANGALDLSFRAQQVWSDVQQNPPTRAQMDDSNRLSQQSFGLQLLVTPLAAGSLMGALAIPAVLARRWQVREDEAQN
jgi:hypothetical protein